MNEPALHRVVDAETKRKSELLVRVLWGMVVGVCFGAGAAFLDPVNSIWTTVVFYCGTVAGLLVVGLLVRTGYPRLAAWILSSFLWVIVAFVTVHFGGLRGSNSSLFAVIVLLVGGLVGGRAAVFVGLLSSAWCGLIVYWEVHGLLPAPLVPYSPINAWAAVTITLTLTAVLLMAALNSLRRTYQSAEAAALERDQALLRSIRSQKMELVGNLTSGIAHDFNNLLTVISSALAALRQDLPELEGEAKASLEDVEAATFRATLMTRQLLSLGRARVGELSALDLGALVRELAGMLPRLLGSTIEIEVDAPLGNVVMASRVGLEQMLLNLAVNAREAMPEGGRLLLRVFERDGSVVVEIRDEGVGMDEPTQERVFEPFFTTKTTGTGLGLSTVRQQVVAFGGTIAIESAPGRGTTFSVRLPRCEDVVPVRPVEAPSPSARSGGYSRPRLLLVEDDPLVRRGLCRWLTQEGFEVIQVADGEEAWALVGSLRGLNCVLSDLSMPRMDGETLMARLALAFPRLPVVIMSGNRRPLEPLPGPKYAFVDKPLDHALLRRTLDEVMQA